MPVWLRRVLFGLLALVLLVMAIILGGYAYLTSSAGQTIVRTKALAALKGTLQGELTLESSQLLPGYLVLRGVRLRDPQGALVAELDTLEAHFAPWHLLERHLLLNDARVSGLRLHLDSDERGLDL